MNKFAIFIIQCTMYGIAIVKAAQWLIKKKNVNINHKFYTNVFTILLSPQHLRCTLHTLNNATHTAVNMYRIKQNAFDVPVSKFKNAAIITGV